MPEGASERKPRDVLLRGEGLLSQRVVGGEHVRLLAVARLTSLGCGDALRVRCDA